MKKALPFCLLLVVVLACNFQPKERVEKPITGPFANIGELNKKINAAIKKKKKWDYFQITKLEAPNKITIHLNYAAMPSSMSEVADDTRDIAQKVLDLLRAEKYDSKKEWLELFVHAQRPERGASGSDMVRSFGKTMYDFNSDSLEFKRK